MPVNPWALQASYFAGSEDDMGLWDYTSGAGDNPFALMGADPTHPAVAAYAQQAVAMQAAKAQAIKQALAQQMPGGNDRTREQVLPLDSGVTIAKTATSTITSSPQRAFRPERLVIDPGSAQTSAPSGGNIGSVWIVNSLTVGADPQFLSPSGSVPGSLFSPQAVGVRLKGTVAVPGIQIILNVTNSDTANAYRFLGAVIGPTLG